MEKNGAEMLRLWTAAGDYQSDVVFSEAILTQLSESYRKIRNTCRYLCRTSTTSFRRAIASTTIGCASSTSWPWASCASATTKSSRPTSATRFMRWCGS